MPSFQYAYSTHVVHKPSNMNKQPKSYSDLQEGFYNSNDLLDVYPYLAYLTNPHNPSLSQRFSDDDDAYVYQGGGYPVYIHIHIVGIEQKPQLWIQVMEGYETLNSTTGVDEFRFGSSEDPLPTLIRTETSESDVIRFNTGGGDMTFASTDLACPRTHIINCQFISGVYGLKTHMQPQSADAPIPSATFTDCYFVSGRNKKIIIVDAWIKGTSVITTEYFESSKQLVNNQGAITLIRPTYLNSEFYTGGTKLTLILPFTFIDSKQTPQTEPLTGMIRQPQTLHIEVCNTAYLMKQTNNTQYPIPQQFSLRDNKYGFIGINSTFTDIHIILKVTSFFDNCTFTETTPKRITSYTPTTTPIILSYAYMTQCIFNSIDHVRNMTITSSYIKESVFNVAITDITGNYFGLNNKFTYPYHTQEITYDAPPVTSNSILCIEDSMMIKGIPITSEEFEEIAEKNNGILDLSVIESDKELYELIKNIVMYDSRVGLFGYKDSGSMLLDYHYSIRPLLISHAGVHDKTYIKTRVESFIVDNLSNLCRVTGASE